MKDVFRRWFLPAIVFQAVLIAGGYATGRELAEFFLVPGPSAGLAGMVVAMATFSVVAMTGFGLGRLIGAYNYRDLIRNLLGPGWFIFEIAYTALLLLVLSVAEAGSHAVMEAIMPGYGMLGSAIFACLVILIVSGGSDRVETVFRYFFFVRMTLYIALIIRAFELFGVTIVDNISASTVNTAGITGGLTYAGYSVVAVVAALPALRHCRTVKDALVAGGLCGPIAMLPAALFFLAMCAFPGELSHATVPSDALLRRLDSPALHQTYLVVMFGGLIESGTGLIHALNERIQGVRSGSALMARYGTGKVRALVTAAALVIALSVGREVGLIDLIAKGYSSMAVVFLVVFVLPLMTIGLYRLLSARRQRRVRE